MRFKMRLKNGKFFPMVYLEKLSTFSKNINAKNALEKKTYLIKNFSEYFIYFHEFKNDIFNLLEIKSKF